MDRWCLPFDYVDALDFDPVNPCVHPRTKRAWLQMRERRERERFALGKSERERERRTIRG